jgi:YD repeat-containing protein
MLGRLTSAVTPEAGTTSYSYAVSGSLCSGAPTAPCSRTDARSITTTYAYDALNRLTSKSYNDNPQTPTANFFYDQAPSTMPFWTGVSFTNPKGRLVLTCTNTTLGTCTSPATATAYSYDPVGRTANFWQCNPSNCGSSSIYNTHYNYDLAGDVQSWVHPGVFTLTNTVNPAQQITAVQSSVTGANYPQTLGQNITYTAWGAVSTLQNGCVGSGCLNAQETYQYNKQLQPAVMELGTTGNPTADYCLVYNYYGTSPTSCALPSSGTTNNGNVMGYWYQDSVNTSFSHTATYTYDGVNRLATAAATGSSTYNLTFGYTGDGSNGQYGNLNCVTNAQTNGPCPNGSFSASSNRLTTSGFSYDAAGNLTQDSSTIPAHTYQWDAEGRVSSVDNGSTWSFTYNAVGDRVQWAHPGGGRPAHI